MPTTPVPRFSDDLRCPETRAVLQHVTAKWGVRVLLALVDTELRWAEVKREIPGISEKMLIQTLQQLEADGLLVRTAHAVVPPRVDYRLTEAGDEAAALVAPLVTWAHERVHGTTVGAS